MFLEGKDYLSVWEIAHRWAQFDPDATNHEELPEQVRYFTQKIAEGYFGGDLKLRRKNGYFAPREPMYLLLFNVNVWHKQLWRCLTKDEFNKKNLTALFVRRTELLKFCTKEELEQPSFWIKQRQPDAAPKPNVNNRPKEEETDRLLCQAIAGTLWSLDPNIHPAHMAKSKAIQRFGQGRSYKDLNTIKRWIAEVDPLKNQRNSGRPPDVTYKIELEIDPLLED